MAHTPDTPSDPPELNEVDLTLRHVAQLFPEDLARALLPSAATLTECAWLDTQVRTAQVFATR